MNNKKQFIWLLLFIGLIHSSVTAQTQQPNIVLIISDDHAYQAISAYNKQLAITSNIDRIANEGVIFNKAYVTNSLCGPSRAAILTGKYSNKNGYKENEKSFFDASQNSFIKELTKSGYQTAWIGKYHIGNKPEGFTYWQILPGQGMYYNPDFILMDGSKKRIEGYVTNIVENIAEDWLNNRDTTKPFCIVIGHKATHRTWMPDTCDLGMFDKKTFSLPQNFYDDYKDRLAAQQQDMTISKTMIMGYDLKMFDNEEDENKEGSFKRMNTAQKNKFNAYYAPIYEDFKLKKLSGNALTEWKFQRYMKDYLSTAASLDRNIGRMLNYLDTHHLSQNTIVIYMSDQGFFLGEHGWFDKRWMYEESFRTPMVMRYPKLIQPGTIDNHFVLNIDIAPTLLQASGITIPKDMQGESFLPLIKNKNSKGRKAIYYHYYENGEHNVSPQFGIKTNQYKLIRFYKRVESWELYDLQKDPHEMHNLFGKNGYEKIAIELKKKLETLIKEYDDDDALQLLHQQIPETKWNF
ncbi:MAG: sulfatase [Bacteroidetes bacterium]|nr:sulfatase [Bacteroidota bacterium]MBS1650067.1 sulfatase [Bacteroidota bacterium]